MIALGYFNRWTSKDVTYYLPHNSLWKLENISLEQAVVDIRNVIKQLNTNRQGQPVIELQRCIVVPVVPWTGIPGTA
jgi:hypothetical protein